MQKTVTVIAETTRDGVSVPTLECVEEGREVADALGATLHVLLAGHRLAPLTDDLAAHGADSITLLEHEALEHFSADGWLAVLAPALQESAPLLALAPDTGHVRAWLPRLATRWQMPLVSGCLQVGVDRAGQVELTRPTHNGARHEQLICPGADTVLATLAPGVRGIGTPRRNRTAKITRHTPTIEVSNLRDRAVRTLPADPRTVDLTEAERIVSGGLGLGGPEGVEKLRTLADLLGAAVGGTRVISDRGWLEVDRFIGTTGKIIAPRLYVAFGVSGAGQHISGITSSETIILVNTDRTAPLFSIADLGIVGDLHAIVPQLIDRLQQEKNGQRQESQAKTVTAS